MKRHGERGRRSYSAEPQQSWPGRPEPWPQPDQPQPGPTRPHRPPPRPRNPPHRPAEPTTPHKRVPVPAPADPDSRQQERERARAERKVRQRQSERRIPTWRGDFGQWMLAGGFATLLGIVLILCVRWRILINDRGQVVEGADIWAGLTPMLCALLWPVFNMSVHRPDNGFRRTGLARLTMATMPVFLLMQVLSMLLWPWFIGPDLQEGTVLAGLSSDPMSFLVGVVVSGAVIALFTALMMVFAAGGVVAALVCLLPFLGAIVGLGFYSAHTLTNPPSMVGLLIWSALAVVFYGLCLGAAALVTHLRRNDPVIP